MQNHRWQMEPRTNHSFVFTLNRNFCFENSMRLRISGFCSLFYLALVRCLARCRCSDTWVKIVTPNPFDLGRDFSTAFTSYNKEQKVSWLEQSNRLLGLFLYLHPGGKQSHSPQSSTPTCKPPTPTENSSRVMIREHIYTNVLNLGALLVKNKTTSFKKNSIPTNGITMA